MRGPQQYRSIASRADRSSVGDGYVDTEARCLFQLSMDHISVGSASATGRCPQQTTFQLLASPTQFRPFTTTTTTTTTKALMMNGDHSQPTSYICEFAVCKSRSWLKRFASHDDWVQHCRLHRCQCLVVPLSDSRAEPESSFRQCPYIPRDEEDLQLHLESHFDNREIPTMRYVIIIRAGLIE